ncbi:MAG TPA: N,N-dimethylformamidase beta subunit family domain-containing protein [Actinomycetota bacterium]|nr:N,N-dimethylformamidase beta subunit family domain-containing protein [Actinomycetota bacterium]
MASLLGSLASTSRARIALASIALVGLTVCTLPAGPRRAGSAVAPRAPVIVPALLNNNAIRFENRHKGDPNWHLRYPQSNGIEGYASATSVAAGRPIRFFISTTATSYTVDVFRMGWYGGAGARLMAHIGPLAGRTQSPCVLEPRRMVDCRWVASFTLLTRPDWVSGAYLARLNGTNQSDSFVPFVVRETTPRAPILVQLSVTTWQAYNRWGGYDLYRGPIDRLSDRAFAVTFDRPYSWPGAGLFFVEYPMIYWLESRGYDVAYSTDIDLHQSNDALSKRRIFMSIGHDEYYSTVMRDSLETALRHGVSLIFAGGNDLFRHIRFESSALGPDRVEVNYKVATLDPYLKTDPSEVTNQWRDPPVDRPEQALLGAQHAESRQFHYGPWKPTLHPAWLFAGTSFVHGSEIPRLFGWEHDVVEPGYPVPPGLEIVASVTPGHGGAADSTFYVAPSGAGVFDAGAIWFDCALGPGCWYKDLVPIDKRVDFDANIHVDGRLQRLMENLIAAMLSHAFHLRAARSVTV